MLWLKGWLETRFRIVVGLFMVALILFTLHSSRGKMPIAGLIQFSIPTMAMMVFIVLAGAGILTQSPLRATKGLHGSMLFTVSLPTSRFRLVAVRAAIGWLEAACIIGLMCACLWRASSALRLEATPAQMLEQAGVLIACNSVFYFLSVVLATFLEDLWRVWGTMVLGIALFWLSQNAYVPAAVDFFRAMGKESPVIAHSVSWGMVSFAAALSAVLFGIAVTIARMREY